MEDVVKNEPPLPFGTLVRHAAAEGLRAPLGIVVAHVTCWDGSHGCMVAWEEGSRSLHATNEVVKAS